MRKDFIVSKIEASQDGSPYVYISITDHNDPKSSESGRAGRNLPQSPFGIGIGAVPFTSPEDLMKNCLRQCLICWVGEELVCLLTYLYLKLV